MPAPSRMGPIVIADLDQEDSAIQIETPAGTLGDVIRVVDSTGAVVQRVPAGGGVQKATFEYLFSRSGGAQGAITLTDPNGRAQSIPDNAVILRAYLEGIATMSSGGAATVALGITGATVCFLAATAYNNAAFNVDNVQAIAAQLPRKTSAVVNVLATVATADITTGGQFRVHVEYVIGA